jgi:hypothetical protein
MLGPFFGSFTSQLGERLGSQPPLGASFTAVVASALCLINAVMAYAIFKETRPPLETLEIKNRMTLSHFQKFRLTQDFLKRPWVGRFLLMTFFHETNGNMYVFIKIKKKSIFPKNAITLNHTKSHSIINIFRKNE